MPKIRCFSLKMFFRKHVQKDNITFHPNNTVSYREYRSYYFEPTMSVGNESDVITIPNMLVLVSRHFLLPIFAISHNPLLLNAICVYRVHQSCWKNCLLSCGWSSALRSRSSTRVRSWQRPWRSWCGVMTASWLTSSINTCLACCRHLESLASFLKWVIIIIYCSWGFMVSRLDKKK